SKLGADTAGEKWDGLMVCADQSITAAIHKPANTITSSLTSQRMSISTAFFLISAIAKVKRKPMARTRLTWAKLIGTPAGPQLSPTISYVMPIFVMEMNTVRRKNPAARNRLVRQTDLDDWARFFLSKCGMRKTMPALNLVSSPINRTGTERS